LATAASASTVRATTLGVATHTTGVATKVTVGSTWTLERTGTGCENDTFGARRHFSSAITDGSGDGGTYKAKKNFSMTWRSGLATGAVFSGRWTAAAGDYTGRYSLGGQSMSATLVPYVTGACLSSTSMNAHPYSSSVALGAGAIDTATVYGNGNVPPTGTVTVYVCPGDVQPCTVATATTDGATLNGVALTATGNSAAARSPAYTAPAIGPYCFLAVYSGDSHYAASSDGATSDQCFTVVNGDDVVTTPSTSSLSLGGSVFDTATVTGDAEITPTGTVTFYVCGPATSETPCTVADRTELGAPVSVSIAGAVNLVTAASVSYTPPGVGGYCFVGLYSGDGNYAPGTDGSASECFTVSPPAVPS
jgi:hypothetical protein